MLLCPHICILVLPLSCSLAHLGHFAPLPSLIPYTITLLMSDSFSFILVTCAIRRIFYGNFYLCHCLLTLPCCVLSPGCRYLSVPLCTLMMAFCESYTRLKIFAKKKQVECTKTIRRQWKRDIVDTFTHSFCANGHIVTKGAGFPTVWREGWKEPDGTHSGSRGGLSWVYQVGPLLLVFALDELLKDDNVVNGANGWNGCRKSLDLLKERLNGRSLALHFCLLLQ
jgi:hypothetical protein